MLTISVENNRFISFSKIQLVNRPESLRPEAVIQEHT